jgi:hypothetical protein
MFAIQFESEAKITFDWRPIVTVNVDPSDLCRLERPKRNRKWKRRTTAKKSCSRNCSRWTSLAVARQPNRKWRCRSWRWVVATVETANRPKRLMRTFCWHNKWIREWSVESDWMVIWCRRKRRRRSWCSVGIFGDAMRVSWMTETRMLTTFQGQSIRVQWWWMRCDRKQRAESTEPMSDRVAFFYTWEQEARATLLLLLLLMLQKVSGQSRIFSGRWGVAR